MASGTPLDPYSIDKSPIISEITTLKNRDLGPVKFAEPEA